MPKTKIIGTGLTGLVGSRIVELLSREFEWVDFSLNTNIDITDPKVLNTAFDHHQDAQAVLHLAAFTDVNKAWDQKGDRNGLCYRINVLGTANIAALCRQYQKYLIHISTDFVFDGQNPPAGGYTEESKPNPIEWYGETKYLAEQEVKKSGTNYSIVRIAFPYKREPSLNETYIETNGQKEYKKDLVRRMIDKFKQGMELRLFEDQLICPTLIDDIALCIRKLLIQRPDRQLFHCVGSEAVSPYQIALAVVKYFGWSDGLVKPVSLSEHLKDKRVRPYQRSLVLNVDKLYNNLNIKTMDLKEGLKIFPRV